MQRSPVRGDGRNMLRPYTNTYLVSDAMVSLAHYVGRDNGYVQSGLGAAQGDGGRTNSPIANPPSTAISRPIPQRVSPWSMMAFRPSTT